MAAPSYVTGAPAKVNLTLEVTGRRADGYHDVASILAAVSLCDSLSLAPAPDWRVTVDAPPPLLAELEGDGNLVTRALAAATRAFPRGPAAHLHLVKRIPAAAGLGGGSSDAAAALRLLCAYWADEGAHAIPPGDVWSIAAGLGSDVPFFLSGGIQVATGRGEALASLPDPAPLSFVVLTPPFTVERKTARLYGLLGPARFSDGAATRHLAAHLRERRFAPDLLTNVFDTVAEQAFPGLGAYRTVLSQAAGVPAMLCGAGPSLLAPAASAQVAAAVAARLRAGGHDARAVRTLTGTKSVAIARA